jgi:XrtJ-associated TM-motif-TM protein
MVAAPLWAQTGCTDSPEDPTVMLALVAGAAAFTANLLRFRRRKQ